MEYEMLIMKTANNIVNLAIESCCDFASRLSQLLHSKGRAFAFAFLIALAFAGASNTNAAVPGGDGSGSTNDVGSPNDIVFSSSVINGSFGQNSVANAGFLFYGMQPFVVTPDLACAASSVYKGDLSTDAVEINSNLTGLDVRTWQSGYIYSSNLTDA